MSTPEQRRLWHQRAQWLAQLGLADDEPAPVNIIEEVANACLVMLDEIARLEREPGPVPQTAATVPATPVAQLKEAARRRQEAPLALASLVLPGTCLVCRGCAQGFASGSQYWHVHQSDCRAATLGGDGRLMVSAAVTKLLAEVARLRG